MLLLMADYTLCPRPCPAKEGFFLVFPPGGFDRIPFLPSLAQTPLEVFSILGLGPWTNIYINMDSLASHPYNIYIYIYINIYRDVIEQTGIFKVWGFGESNNLTGSGTLCLSGFWKVELVLHMKHVFGTL